MERLRRVRAWSFSILLVLNSGDGLCSDVLVTWAYYRCMLAIVCYVCFELRGFMVRCLAEAWFAPNLSSRIQKSCTWWRYRYESFNRRSGCSGAPQSRRSHRFRYNCRVCPWIDLHSPVDGCMGKAFNATLPWNTPKNRASLYRWEPMAGSYLFVSLRPKGLY